MTEMRDATRRRVACGVLLTIVTAALVVALLTDDGNEDDSRSRTPSATLSPSRFVPPTRDERGTEVLPITFPDGRRVELSYPRTIAAGVPAIRISASVAWPLRPDPRRCCGRNLIISYRTIESVYGDLEPITTYPGIDGKPVPYFDGVGRSTNFDILVFQFETWLVEIYDRRQPGEFEGVMSEEERATWVRSLGGHADEYGYLVLDAQPPLRVDAFANAAVYLPIADGIQIELADGYCGHPESDTSMPRRYVRGDVDGASWCDAATELHISVQGEQGLVSILTEAFGLRALTPGFPSER
jgi:hypothetical protein